MATTDVEMAGVGSRSSSLTPPPSSLPERFEDPRAASRRASNSSEEAWEDVNDQNISLEPISLSALADEEMVTTRSQRKAEEQARNGGTSTEPPPGFPRSPSPKTAPARKKKRTELPDSPDDAALIPPSPGKRKRNPTKKMAPKIIVKKQPARSKKKWTPETLLTDEKSPLGKADIRAILSRPKAWDVLTPDDKAAILALMPPNIPIIDAGTPGARPDMALLASDDNFRHDCALFTENLRDGKHDPQWLAEAWAAHDQRHAGDFDEYLRAKFEKDWGEPMPQNGAQAAEARTSEEVATTKDGEGMAEGGGDGNRNGHFEVISANGI